MGEETVWGQSESLGGELNSYEVDLFLTCCANILMDSGIHVLDTN